MPIRFCNSLTYSDCLFPFTGLESKHSAGSPPSPSYLGNCRFLDNSKQQSNSRSPSPLSSYSEPSHTAQSPSSSKSFIGSNTGRLGPSHKFNSNNQLPRTPSPSNSNRSSRSTSPRNAFNAVKQLTSPTYEAGSDEPIHHYINFYQMRRRNGGGMNIHFYMFIRYDDFKC
ncbi:hypothetical protein PRIPAC_86487 [Pristionchus pacificus]|uniref:Uncharacterized protein n=1 Tax=Pristionchus pacificus TaxID=54126 RepID=A0A2A6BTN7_PRIPA|nr:hypothetical protein PRIPAC_86487 [Pristionchus pacificus]|eukprot:PDM69176.1 hypothetical protein PRIPAC_47478 [Pristionchus pacificus]